MVCTALQRRRCVIFAPVCLSVNAQKGRHQEGTATQFGLKAKGK
jgi:hypothetical protein